MTTKRVKRSTFYPNWVIIGSFSNDPGILTRTFLECRSECSFSLFNACLPSIKKLHESVFHPYKSFIICTFIWLDRSFRFRSCSVVDLTLQQSKKSLIIWQNIAVPTTLGSSHSNKHVETVLLNT